MDGIKKKKQKEQEHGKLPDYFKYGDDFSIFEQNNSPTVLSGETIVGSSKKTVFSRVKKVLFALGLTALVLLIVSGAKDTKARIAVLAESSHSHLSSSFEFIEKGDLESSLKESDLAQKDIEELKLLLQSWGQDIQLFKMMDSGKSTLTTNERLLDSSYSIIKTLNSLGDNIKFDSKNSGEDFVGKGNKYLFNISESQEPILKTVVEARKILEKNKVELLKAENSVEKKTASEIAQAISLIDKTTDSLAFYETLLKDDLPWLSGSDGSDKNILLLFANNDELRGGSGGFLGSFGVARFSKGKLKNVDFGVNIYKIDNAFVQKEKIPAPEDLKWVNGNWALRDAGWAVDGPEAMQKILWFYNKETGKSVDGAIMIDATAVATLLGDLGPIEMKAYGKTITEDNFSREIETEVQQDYWNRPGGTTENEPKKILADMMPIFLDRLFSALSDREQSKRVFSSISKSLQQKDITMYFTKEDFQKRIDKMNYSGKVYPASGDYLYLNNSNLNGEKSSQKIFETVELDAVIGENGSVSDTLNISRRHTGDGVWPDGINRNFVRLLLPENSKINSFEPIEGNFQEFYEKGYKNGKDIFWLGADTGKTEVKYWMSTKPAEESKALIKYSPSYLIDTSGDEFTYVMSVQKQPGAKAGKFSLTLHYPENFVPLNVKKFDQEKKSLTLNFETNRDFTIKIKFQKQN